MFPPIAAEPSLAGRRILFVLPTLEMGGAERQALLLAQHLRDVDGALVELWGFSRPGPLADSCAGAGIPCREVRAPWPPRLRGRLRVVGRLTRELRRTRPEVILAYSLRPNVLCGLTWRLAGARLCVWGQRDEGLDGGVPLGWQRFAARQTPVFVTNSVSGGSYLVDELGVLPERIHRVPNGVRLAPAQHSRQKWRARLGVPENRPLATMVANLHRFKDHRTLLLAWRRVVLSSGAAAPILLLAGNRGDTADSLETLGRELELDQHVRFLGAVEDVAGLLGAVDLAVFSSRSEGCPNAVLEAMAAGLPVAATASVGTREALGPNSPLAAAGDADALARLVLELLGDPQRHAELGRANRQRIATDFDPHRSCRAMARIIECALGPTRGRAPARQERHAR